MQNINIYFSEDSELSECEAVDKGYRVDVYVEVGNNIYNLQVYTLIRLKQDFETEYETCGNYLAEPNLVIVREASKKEIISTIKELQEQEYFSKIKPMDNSSTIELVAKGIVPILAD